MTKRGATAIVCFYVAAPASPPFASTAFAMEQSEVLHIFQVVDTNDTPLLDGGEPVYVNAGTY